MIFGKKIIIFRWLIFKKYILFLFFVLVKLYSERIVINIIINCIEFKYNVKGIN